jgi:hypothetical protein
MESLFAQAQALAGRPVSARASRRVSRRARSLRVNATVDIPFEEEGVRCSAGTHRAWRSAAARGLLELAIRAAGCRLPPLLLPFCAGAQPADPLLRYGVGARRWPVKPPQLSPSARLDCALAGLAELQRVLHSTSPGYNCAAAVAARLPGSPSRSAVAHHRHALLVPPAAHSPLCSADCRGLSSYDGQPGALSDADARAEGHADASRFPPSLSPRRCWTPSTSRCT